MNKNRFLKALILGFVMAVTLGFWTKRVTALMYYNNEVTLQYPFSVPIPEPSYTNSGWADLNKIESVLVDDFEHEYYKAISPYWFAGLDLGIIQCMLDFEEGSKVLDVYRLTSDYLSILPPYKFTKVCKWTDFNDADDTSPIWGDFCKFRCKIRFPLSFENWDNFGITVNCTVFNKEDGQSYQVNVLMLPIEFLNSHETLENSLKKIVSI